MRKKIKFLTVVWGVSYINQFCSLSLPSFLAPGNLPLLSERADLEVVIMTQRNDYKKFEKHKSFKLLKKICSVRFIAIDDLIVPDMYGVTLTLAYSRPIIECGKEMLNIHFIFMNADFVLANGSLLGLYKHIEEERAIVLGPSFRAIAEDLEPILENYYDSVNGVLSISPREMVGLSLPHPHKTTIAKYQNQTKTFSSHPNQFFWPVDKHTLLGRYYLIFMLALKPERVITSINSYCDYGLIPELCPSGDEVAMGDSDDFFMLELQNRDQELNMLHSKPMKKKAIAQSLNQWTTKEHRRAASHNIIFHSKGIPPKINKSKKLASNFIAGIKRYLLKPKSHAHHKYWVGGIISWKSRKQFLQEDKVIYPPEMGFGILEFKKIFSKISWVNRRKLFQEGKVFYQSEMVSTKVKKVLGKGQVKLMSVPNSSKVMAGSIIINIFIFISNNLKAMLIFTYHILIRMLIILYYNIVAEISSKHVALISNISISSFMPGWLSYRLLKKTFSDIDNMKKKEINIYADDYSIIQRLLPKLKNVNWSSLKDLNHIFQKRIGKKQALIIFVRDIKYKALTKQINLLFPKMTKGSQLFIYFLPKNDEPVNKSKLFLDNLNLSGFNVHKIESTGGKTVWRLNSLLRYFYRVIYPTNYNNNNNNGPMKIFVRILATISILIYLPLIWLVNSYLIFLQPKKGIIHHFRCVYIELRK